MRNRQIIFDNALLLPRTWIDAVQRPVWAFNPAILPDGNGGWIFAYRMVLQDQLRRIAICRLDAGFQIVLNSSVPLSDLIRVPPSDEYSEVDRTWFADPRLYRLTGRLFLYWNSGWHDSLNAQFLQELSVDTLLPCGAPRMLTRNGSRRMIEKNWMLFGDDPLFAVYSVGEQQILQARPDGLGSLHFDEVFRTEWDATPYVREFGELRGGAPPQLVERSYYCFCHSVCPSAAGHRYVPGVYRFASQPPFPPTHGPAEPVPLQNPFGIASLYPRLNPAVGEVLYPSGAIFQDGNWVISYGINDERCAIAILPHADILACLRPL